MTKEQFEQQYAANSKVTVAFLHAHGLRAIPCACGEPGCQRWQMTNTSGLSIEELDLHQSRQNK